MGAVHGAVPDRAALAGIIYVPRNGVAWRDVPVQAVGCSGVTGRLASPARRNPARTASRGPAGPGRDSQSPGVTMAPLRSGRQQPSNPLPQVIRYEINRHPETLPTKIARCKVYCSLT
jgi:hypothetical protein